MPGHLDRLPIITPESESVKRRVRSTPAGKGRENHAASDEGGAEVTATEPTAARPVTGEEYLESLRDDRTIFLHGERVKDVTTPPRQVRPWLERGRGARPCQAHEAAWDAMGTEFGGRHELYERMYAGTEDDTGSRRCREPRRSASPTR
jgi:hypothetical protein